ncbi:hypothetical protein BV898_11475 [Hypsibius exemplaris]|uniref:Uncharacterized protein n=1 Tax=Hypsibius exemplaris TaxID=2072580 RepID=A0A1W0WGP1_HYPEX|nr:hypothetical protein BV898_11475 [Hypsibius exemplaris]
MKKNPPVKPGRFLQPIPVSGSLHAVGFDDMGSMVTDRRGNKFLLLATCRGILEAHRSKTLAEITRTFNAFKAELSRRKLARAVAIPKQKPYQWRVEV